MENDAHEYRIAKNEREIDDLRVKVGIILKEQREISIEQREAKTRLDLFEKHQDESKQQIIKAIEQVNTNVATLTEDLKTQKEISDKRSGAIKMGAWSLTLFLTVCGLVVAFWNAVFGG